MVSQQAALVRDVPRTQQPARHALMFRLVDHRSHMICLWRQHKHLRTRQRLLWFARATLFERRGPVGSARGDVRCFRRQPAAPVTQARHGQRWLPALFGSGVGAVRLQAVPSALVKLAAPGAPSTRFGWSPAG